MERSIDDRLNGEQPSEEIETPVVTEPGPETAIAEPVAGQPRDEHGRFAPKETGVEQPAPVAEPQVPPTEQQHDRLPRDVYEPLKAIRDENRGLKDELRQIREQFSRLPQPQAQPQQPPVDFWDDPQSFMDQRMNQLGSQLLQQWDQRQTAQRMDASEQAAKAKYSDYDDAFRAFEQAVHANPQLQVDLAQAPDPGEFAYHKGKTALALQSVGSIDDLRAQIRAELEAEARAAIAPARLSLPSTTAADTSVGGRSGPDWAGPTPLGKILG